MFSQGTYFLLLVLKLILLHCTKRALFSLCRMRKTEVLITFYHLMHHNFICSTALPSVPSLFQLTQAKITQWCLSPWESPFLTEVWLLLWTQRGRRSWVWGWVMHRLPEGRRKGTSLAAVPGPHWHQSARLGVCAQLAPCKNSLCFSLLPV